MTDDPHPDEQPSLDAHNQALVAECKALAKTLQEQHHIGIEFDNKINLLQLRPAMEMVAVHRLLVEKGLITDDEWWVALHTALRDQLRAVLETAENAQAEGKPLMTPTRQQLVVAPELPRDVRRYLARGKNHD